MSYSMSRDTKALARAVILHAEKTTPLEAIEQLKMLCLCSPDSEKQSHSPSDLCHILTYLQDPESQETGKQQHIRQDHGK
ncbi:hypothetical protein ACIP6T_22735 [Pantoea sp. NPDC088449]|uniref:hypothetical protein n=1 Tax=Pantoea sp. NPDC088449 TaxID=3364392 RepID=UPI0038304FAE